MSNRITIETKQDVLGFSADTGQLVSFRSKAAPDQEFVCTDKDEPAFVVQYLDETRRFRQLSSHDAESTQIELQEGPAGSGRIVGTFHRLSGLDLTVVVQVRASSSDRFSHWSISLGNDAGLAITDVQYPFIVLNYALEGAAESNAIVWPFEAGKLLQNPKPEDLEPDSPHAWQFRPENGGSSHYPGLVNAQFLAYYNDRAGLYLASHDTAGAVKLIKPVHHEPGLRLGISHWGDWPEQGERELEYDIVVTGFAGDWYEAAGLYREWSLQQHWAAKPLHSREDVPEWLLDSPPHIILRIQGELDFGPAEPNEEFLPYPKMLPMLDTIAERIEAPLVGVIMSWERPGPWIYPDCFPPAGGFDSLREFTSLMRDRGWPVGSFCNGTRWVVGHYWSGYDGVDYFDEQGGADTVCRMHTDALWREAWDATWRPSYTGCLGVGATHEIALDFIHTLVDSGLDWIQFLDQNVGCATFPCFATDHGHPSIPGRWMTSVMEKFVDDCDALRREELAKSDGERELIFSVEATVNEYFIPGFHLTDVRVVPPGHLPGRGWIPLYHYLYHELIVIQGGFGRGPEPYHMPTRNAYNLVVGEIPGAVMKGDGKLLNWDTGNWAPWEPDVGDNDDSLAMLASTAALRRGPAKDFLVFGRMQSPVKLNGVEIQRWQHGGTDHQIPAVFDGAWRAPDGRFGVVLANWTTSLQKVALVEPRLGARVVQHVSHGQVTSTERYVDGSLAVVLPPLSCVLLEAEQ